MLFFRRANIFCHSHATAAAKYAISLRGHIDKRVLWPQDMIQPDEEEQIKEQMKKVDSMYEALKK